MSRPIRLLIADDEDGLRETLREHFESKGFEVAAAADGEAALALFGERPVDVAVVDVQMPGMDGLALMREARRMRPWLEVIIITGQGSIEAAVAAIQDGAFTYQTKPLRLSALEAMVRRAAERAELSRGRDVERRAAPEPDPPPALVEMATRVAASDTTVLIQGETGAGKEVLARFIHRRSSRAAGPFVVVDCGALAESVLERELFGHERGAFTGADEARPGLVSLAEGGTLLIDEIGHASPAVQARLMRLIERGTFRRVGDPHEVRADVRIIASTHRDLTREPGFREDLYHRLNVVQMTVPPLRERRGEVLPLAAKFLSRGRRLSPAAERALMDYGWPGNVRELANVIQRACLIARGDVVEPADLGIASEAAAPLTLEAAEARHIASVLAGVGGDKAKAADLLGISVRQLYRKLADSGR